MYILSVYGCEWMGIVVDVEACAVQVYLARLRQRIRHVPRRGETCSTRSSWVYVLCLLPFILSFSVICHLTQNAKCAMYFTHLYCITWTVFVAQWFSGQRTWNLNSATRVRFSGRVTIPLSSNLGQVVYSHCLPSFSAPRNWGTKGSFRRLSGYGD